MLVRIHCNRPGFVRVTNQICSFILRPRDIPGVGQVARSIEDVERRPGTSRKNTVDLPVADNVIGYAAAGRKSLTLAYRNFIDGVDRQDMGQIEPRRAAT